MANKRLNSLLVTLTVSLLSCGRPVQEPLTVQEPASESQELYNLVPKADRESLRLGIEKVLTLQKEGKWDEMYEWLDNEEGITKGQFLQTVKESRVLAFEPDHIFYFPPEGFWVVSGCALYAPRPPLLGRGTGGVISSFTARRTVGGWRFSRPAVALSKDSPGGIRECSLTK